MTLPSLRLDQRVVRSPEPVAAQTGEGLALLSTDQNKYFVLNNSSAAVWARLADPIALDDLAKGIAADFDLPIAEAGDAVLEVVSQFLENQLASIADRPFLAREGTDAQRENRQG